MKGILCKAFGAPESLEYTDLPDPVPGPGEVVVEARAIGLNYPDLLQVAGTYQRLPQLPFVPGRELAGVVQAVGPGVSGFSVGEQVLAGVDRGAYAERVAAPARQCWKMPHGIGFTDAAAMGLVYQTAWFALHDRAQFVAGETVLVLGAGGGVGMACVQLAAALGAKVLAGVSHLDRSALAREAGATWVIDLGAAGLRDGLREQVSHATGGHMADVILDPVGGDAFDAAIRALGWRGRYIVIGFAGGRIPSVKTNYLLLKNIAVSGLQWTDYRERWSDRVAEAQDKLFGMLMAGRLGPHIAGTAPLAEAGAALARLQRREILGKLVLMP